MNNSSRKVLRITLLLQDCNECNEQVLKDNPAVKVELGSHTDVRGSDAYNMSLSDNRAESAVRYLVDRCGVSKNNITWKGYGETELVNSCANGVNCSESEHQMNRRTELKITGILDEDPLWKHSLKEIIEHPDKLNMQNELNLSQHYPDIKSKYGDVLKKLAQ